jgi:hypothetical protein
LNEGLDAIRRSLRFRESPEFGSLLMRVLTRMASNPNALLLFNHRAAELFNTIDSPIDSNVIGQLRARLPTSEEKDIELIARIFREADNGLVFREREFTLQLLERAHQISQECYRGVSSQLYAATVSGMRSGSPGVPFPEDTRLRDNAREVFKEIPRFTPGYDLFKDLETHAERNIARAIKEGEDLDDE